MKNINLLITFLLMGIMTGCSGQSRTKDVLGLFDISPNNEIIFSFMRNGKSSIYALNSVNGNLRKIISSTRNKNYYNPRYSPDGGKIVFIANSKDGVNSILCLANVDGTEIDALIDNSGIITEATFSLDGKLIYFCKANTYDKYSTIGRKDAHDFDIYSLRLEDKKVTKITNIKSYGLSNISEVDSGYILAHIEAGPDGGMCLLSKDGATKPFIIVPENNPRKDASLYYTPIYSDNLKIIGFTAPYELYVMRLNDKVAKLVLSNKGSNDFSNIVFYKNQPKILFSKVGSSNLYTINIDGTNIKTIPINIK